MRAVERPVGLGSAGVPSDLRPATGKDVRSRRERIERLLWRRWKPWRQRWRDGGPTRTVFVAGMQRSGTNMLMETLEWSAQTDVFHETDERAFDNYQMRPRPVIEALRRGTPAPFFVVKSLCELDQVRSLLNAFEPARALWLVRAYDDTVNSATRSFPNFAHQLHRLAKDKNAAEWRGRGMSDDTQQLLRRLDHPGINEASAAALMWYYRNVLLFEQGLADDPRVRVVRYEDLVADPAGELQRIFEFVGIPDWSPWIRRYIHVNSVGKSPQADIEPPVREVCEALYARFDALCNRTAAR
jgi:hypothetical protein